jgi:hypothetical protein
MGKDEQGFDNLDNAPFTPRMTVSDISSSTIIIISFILAIDTDCHVLCLNPSVTSAKLSRLKPLLAKYSVPSDLKLKSCLEPEPKQTRRQFVCPTVDYDQMGKQLECDCTVEDL